MKPNKKVAPLILLRSAKHAGKHESPASRKLVGLSLDWDRACVECLREQ